MDCNNLTGAFPNKFVRKDNLDYVGKTPDLIYFCRKDIDDKGYENLVSDDWNFREECGSATKILV